MLEMLGGLTVELTSVTFCCAVAMCGMRQATVAAVMNRTACCIMCLLTKLTAVYAPHSLRAPAVEPELDQPHRLGRRHAEQDEHQQRREVVRDLEEVAVVGHACAEPGHRGEQLRDDHPDDGAADRDAHAGDQIGDRGRKQHVLEDLPSR